MGRVGVLIVHGMGDQTSDFAEPTIERLARDLDDTAPHVSGPAWWAPVLADLEAPLIRNIQALTL